MASVPPERGVAYSFYTALVSQANTKIFQANPTLAAGDAKVSIDGAAYVNLATLPSVAPASGKQVLVSLSAAEMTITTEATVLLSDAAGAEWCDQLIRIRPVDNSVDDLGTAIALINAWIGTFTSSTASAGSGDSLTTVELVKAALDIADSDMIVPGLSIYHDASVSATAATVQVTDTTIVLVITGGANAGTTTFTLSAAAYDTISELVAAINALGTGWVANIESNASATSGDLRIISATSAYGSANTQTLNIVNNYTIQQIIYGVSGAVEGLLDRAILTASYAERFDGNGEARMFLSQRPITAVDRLSVGERVGLRIKNTDTTNTLAQVSVTSTAVKLVHVPTSGTATTNSLTFASYATLSAMSTAINAIGSGWTASVPTSTLNNERTSVLAASGGRSALNRDVDLMVPEESENDFSYNSDEGYVELPDGSEFTAGRQNIYVEYTAGYATVPFGLQSVVTELCCAAYNIYKTGVGVKSGSFAGVMNWARDTAGMALTKDDLIARLTPWMRKVI